MMRLNECDRWGAILDFAADNVPSGVDVDDYADGCDVIYRDDHDAGTSEYQVVDVQGHGDGSGLWTPVSPPYGDGTDGTMNDMEYIVIDDGCNILWCGPGRDRANEVADEIERDHDRGCMVRERLPSDVVPNEVVVS